jgi:hypothetical protein
MTFRTKRVPFRPGPLKDQGSLLLAGFDLDKAHARPGHRLTDRVGIRGIVLLTFHVGFYVPGRHQSHAVPQLPVLSPNGGRPRRLPSRPGKVPASRRTPAACPALADVERQPHLQHQRRVPEKRLPKVQTNCHRRLHGSPPSCPLQAGRLVESRPQHQERTFALNFPKSALRQWRAFKTPVAGVIPSGNFPRGRGTATRAGSGG